MVQTILGGGPTVSEARGGRPSRRPPLEPGLVVAMACGRPSRPLPQGRLAGPGHCNRTWEEEAEGGSAVGRPTKEFSVAEWEGKGVEKD